MCRLERKSCVKGIGIKQGLGEAGKERNRETENPCFQPNAKAIEVHVHLVMPLPA